MSEPTNDLERALLAAAHAPSERPTFYKLLLESQLFAINTNEERETLQLQAMALDGTPHVAIFSSLPRLHQVLAGARRHVSMDGRALLASIGHSHAILNPGSELRKVLSPEEIAAALNGSLLGTQRHRVPEGGTNRLGLVARLRKLFG